MDQISLQYQDELADKHSAKADQCSEYGKYDDAEVHRVIAHILRQGLIEALNSGKEIKLGSKLS